MDELEVNNSDPPPVAHPEAVWLVADALPVGIVVGTMNGEVRYTNRTLRETFRIDPVGMRGTDSILHFVHPEDQRFIMDKLGEFVPGVNASFRARIVGDDGVCRVAEIRVVTIQHPLVESDYVAILTDVTGEEEMERYLDEVGKLAAVGRFAGTLAHDLRNAVVSARLGLAVATKKLTDGAANQGVGEVLERLEKTDRVLSSAEELVGNIFRIAQDQPLRPGESDLIATMRDIVHSPEWADTCAVRLEHEDSQSDVRVSLAEHDLKRLVSNLLVNAREAGAENIVVRVTPKDSEVVIEVVDDGSGMPRSVLSKAFEPLFTTKGDREGRGLGLTSVLDTVRRAGGRVWIDSAPGEGTTVVLRLPGVVSPTDQAATPSDQGELGGLRTGSR